MAAAGAHAGHALRDGLQVHAVGEDDVHHLAPQEGGHQQQRRQAQQARQHGGDGQEGGREEAE